MSRYVGRVSLVSSLFIQEASLLRNKILFTMSAQSKADSEFEVPLISHKYTRAKEI